MQNISLFDEIMPEYLLADDDEMDTGNNTDARREDGVVAIRGDENLANDAVIDDVQKHDADAELFWQSCLSELKHELKESELNQWLRSLKPVFAKDVLVLFAINDVFIRRIKTHYYDKIRAVVARLASGGGQNVSDVVLRVMSLAPKTERVDKTLKKQKSKSPKKPTSIEESQPLEGRFTFENFVKGKSNVLAYNACQELTKNLTDKTAKQDTHLYFIYGSSGLGKTHLMHAVAHRYERAGLLVCYFSKDQFFKVTINALRGGEGGADSLLRRICQADLLIVDDVHMINNKNGPKVSQFLMLLFGEFTKGDKRLILASDRPPSQMQDFDTRFLSRFEGGLSLAIEPPDIEMRMQILQKKASLLGMELPKDCAIFMAQNMPPDVRRLEGALNQVRANALLVGGEVTLSLVRYAIKDRIEARARAVNAENIRDLVAEYYGVSVKDLIGKKRARNIARPRQMAMALVRELTQDSFPEIGQVFGGRDHTTVIHACEKISELRAVESSVEKDYQALLATLEFA